MLAFDHHPTADRIDNVWGDRTPSASACRLRPLPSRQVFHTRSHALNHTTPSPRTLRLLAAALVACCVAARSTAASTNSVGGSFSLAASGLGVDQLDSFSRGSSVSSVASGLSQTTVGFGGNHTQSWRVDARAGYGSVGISATTSYAMTLPRYAYTGTYETVQASGSATAVFTDVLVTGPGSGNVSTRLRMHLGGVLNTTSVPSTNTDGSVGSASVSFGIYVNNNLVGWGNRGRSSVNGGAPETSSAGTLTGLDSGVLTTPFFSVPRNTPVTVKLEMSANALSRLDGAQNGMTSAPSQYYHSLSFATDQPVFDLPAGYTASSTDGLIVNNSYVPNTNAPVLNIKSLTNGVVLTWLATNQTTQLEYSTNFSAPWFPVAAAPILTNSQFFLTWTTKTDRAFFRLSVP